MKIHLLAEGIDDLLTIGHGGDDDVTPENARLQIPQRPFDQLIPPIIAMADPTNRMIMMYHAALAYIDQNNLWEEEKITFSIDADLGTHSVEVG